jgi:hypothetical protein
MSELCYTPIFFALLYLSAARWMLIIQIARLLRASSDHGFSTQTDVCHEIYVEFLQLKTSATTLEVAKNMPNIKQIFVQSTTCQTNIS